MGNYLVTGASGFIGARTSEMLIEQGHAVVGIDNVNNYKFWNFHPYPQRSYVAELRVDL